MGIHSDVEPTIVICFFPPPVGDLLFCTSILWQFYQGTRPPPGSIQAHQMRSSGLKGWNVVSAWRSYMEYRGPQTYRTVF